VRCGATRIAPAAERKEEAQHEMLGERRARRAFTLVEVLIAVSLGALVMGGAMYLYHQGNQSFFKTTEHAVCSPIFS
jgi:prepilin-type N-terminal cleavage/methylation domain-containing protein